MRASTASRHADARSATGSARSPSARRSRRYAASTSARCAGQRRRRWCRRRRWDCRPCRRRPRCRSRARRGSAGALAVGFAQRVLEHLEEHRQHAVQHFGQVEADVLELVGDARACAGGASAVCQLAVSARRMRSRSARRSAGVRPRSMSATRQATISRSFSSSARRTASVGCAVNTGSMRSRGSSAASFVRRSRPAPASSAEHVAQAAGLRRRAAALVVAAAADAVHALGEVDRLEVGGERAHQVAGVVAVRRSPAPARAVRRPARRVSRRADRGAPHALDLGRGIRRRAARPGSRRPARRAILTSSRSSASAAANSTTRSGSSEVSVPLVHAREPTGSRVDPASVRELAEHRVDAAVPRPWNSSSLRSAGVLPASANSISGARKIDFVGAVAVEARAALQAVRRKSPARGAPVRARCRCGTAASAPAAARRRAARGARPA